MSGSKLRARAGKASVVTLSSFILRLFQFLVGLAVLILYASQPPYRGWQFSAVKFDIGIAAGVMAVITTPLLAIIPFFVGYRLIAFVCPWDLILMAVYAATFAYFKNGFGWGAEGDYDRKLWHDRGRVSYGRIDAMRAAVILDFAGMLLWLTSFLMAVVLLVLNRIRGGGHLE